MRKLKIYLTKKECIEPLLKYRQQLGNSNQKSEFIHEKISPDGIYNFINSFYISEISDEFKFVIDDINLSFNAEPDTIFFRLGDSFFEIDDLNAMMNLTDGRTLEIDKLYEFDYVLQFLLFREFERLLTKQLRGELQYGVG
ncbi:hypothetical protein AB4291_13725 [Vibrio cyclitrophicus]